MTEITMPRLSDSMEQGTIASWLKSDGDRVDAGDELVEIETDKATMTYEAPEAGTLQIVAAEGRSLAVGEPMARIDGAAASTRGGPAPAAEPAPAPTTARAAEPREAGANGSGAVAAAVRATPLARRVAAGHGVDLQTVKGTGPRGRVTRADVVAAASLTLPSPVPAPAERAAPAPALAAEAPVERSAREPNGATSRQELTRIQQVIARRMMETKATVPHFQVQTEAVMDELLALRAQLKAAADRPPSVNDFIVKAAALALREFPLANGSYKEDGFELHAHVNVGVAVAADGALIVPTVTDADTRSVGGIATEVRRLAAAVRDGSIKPAELSGATFTVSNLGMYGMTAITPVINAPQAAILGVGAAREALARVDGEIIERQIMTLTLSCDHRILYGAEASQFLSRIRDLLEQPLQLAF
jgi:pyruvate dehydrogenase E2 component (dihydrolipoamide acetyltransferase)